MDKTTARAALRELGRKHDVTCTITRRGAGKYGKSRAEFTLTAPSGEYSTHLETHDQRRPSPLYCLAMALDFSTPDGGAEVPGLTEFMQAAFGADCEQACELANELLPK